MSAMFREQAMALVQQGATLQAATDQGINPDDFGKNLIAVKAAYDLAKGTWPAGDPSEPAKQDFDKAMEAWNLALSAMNARSGTKIIEGELLWTKVAEMTGGGNGVAVRVEEYEGDKNYGKKYVYLKSLSGVFLGVASGHFQTGKDRVLKRLSESK